MCVCVGSGEVHNQRKGSNTREGGGREEREGTVKERRGRVGGQGARPRGSTIFVAYTCMTRVHTRTHKHTSTQTQAGFAGIALFVVGPLGPIHGNRHGRQIRHGIQGSHLRVLGDIVF